MLYHWDAGGQFRFSTGIGPFQLDRGGYDSWDSWPTIDKLNYTKALESVLKQHNNDPSFGSGTSLKDFSDTSKWYGVRPVKVAEYWNEVTGTLWDDYKNERNELDWSGIRDRIVQNAMEADDMSYEDNVNYKVDIRWNITENDKILTDTGKKIVFNGEYPTWYIIARDAYGNDLSRYYYTYNSEDKIEVLAWNNSGSDKALQYIFVRDYSTGPYPENSSKDWLFGGFTLSHPAISSFGGGADAQPPLINAFSVNPISLTLEEFIEITYTTSDSGGSGLKQVELWRKNETDDWIEIIPERNTLAGENGPFSGSFTDSPPAPGKYWYGVHVVDNAGNWNDERNSNTNYQPESFEPVEVEVIDSSSAQGRISKNLINGKVYIL